MAGKHALYIGAFCRTDERFTFYNGTYMLIYTDKQPPKDFLQIPIEKEKNIGKTERTWLLSCKMQVNQEAMRNAQAEYTEILDSFLNIFTDELKKEAEGVNESNDESQNASKG